MDASHFDTLARSLTDRFWRRTLLRGFATMLGLKATGFSSGADAKNTKSKKRLRRNAFGCVDVGGKCRGKDRACCSGRCAGKKPRNGEKDSSRCVAHDESTCQAGQGIQDCGGGTDVPCITSTGEDGVCTTTTGNAPYCAEELFCRACGTDADCQPFCGEAAACVLCAGCSQGGTACASPSSGLCDFPS